MVHEARTWLRHARPCAGHHVLKERTTFEDVDGRNKSGHDN